MTPNSQDLAYLRANPDVADKFDARFGEGAAARYAAAPAPTAPASIAPGGEPTQRDIDYLRANPGVAEKFNKRFGDGAAAGYLSQIPAEAPQVTPAAVSPTPAPTAAPAEAPAEATPEETSPGILGTLGDMAQGLLHGGQEAINETVQTAESISDAVSEKAGEYGIPTTVQLFNDAGEFDPALLTHQEMKEQGLGTILGGQPNVDDAAQIEAVKHPVTAFGTATSAVSQFLVGYAGASRVTGVRGMVGGFLNGAITDATVFDPDDDNLSAFMEKTGYAIPLLSEALATDPESPEWLNRMRNAAEGVILGGITETAFKGFRAIALARKAKETGSEELATEATRLADEAAAEGEDALANGVPVDVPANASKVADEVTPEVTRVEAPEGTPEAQVEAWAPDAPTEPVVTPLVNEQALRAALADTDKVTLGQLDDSMWFNMDKMDGPLEAQVMIETVGDALARSGALEKLGIDQPETFASVLKGAKEELAGMIGTGVDEFTARVAKVSAVAGEQSKFLVAGKMALQTTGREISRYATRVDAMAKLGKVDPEVESKLLDLMTTHANLQGHLKAVQTAAARATSAGRIVTNDGLDAKALSALERVNAVGGSKVVREMAGKLAAAGSPTQQAKLIRAMNRKGSGPMRVINEVFINSILSGWGTHAVNMASNTLNTVLLPAERVIGGALTRNLDQTRMGLQQYAEFRSAVVDGIRMMGRVLRTENPVLDTEVKLDMQREGFKAISSSGTGPTAALINGIGQIIRLPGRALMAEDEFFKQITFRSRLMANLTVTSDSLTPAQLKKMGYANKGAFIEGEAEKAVMGLQDLEDRWEELVLKGRITDDPKVRQQFIQQNLGAANGASKYAQDALRIAREVTFTTPLDPNTVSAGWQRMANRHPALRQITPFIQTPVNILNKAFDRTPGLNLLRTRYRDRLKSADPAVRAEAAGEMATGVAISTALFMLAHEGRITGGGPADPAKRANWVRDKNWQPYSINLGTSEEPQWVEYKRLDPFFFTFGVAGDVAEMMQASQNDPSFDSATLLTMVVGSTFNTLASKTWLQGIADVVEMISSKDQPQVIQRWFAQRAASMIPLSNAGRTYNRDTDEVSREVRSFIDQVKIRTPGMGSDLPARHDWLTGEEIENPTQLLGFLRVQHGERDTVAQELRRLNYGFAGPDRKIGRIALSSEQYQDWNRMMGTVRLGGRSLHQALERAMQSNHYDLSRDRVPDGVTTASESHRTKVIAPIVAAYKQAARTELFGKYPDLQDAWRRYEVFKGRAGAGQVQQGERENLLLKF